MANDKKRRSIKVVYSKLAKTKAWGWCHEDYVEIDMRLKGKKLAEITIHECMHYLFPELSEEEIEKKSILLTNTLWNEGYRRVDDDNSLPLQDGKK